MDRLAQKVETLLGHTVTIKIDDDLLLRMLQIEDAEQLFETTDRNRPHLRRWLPWVDSNQSLQDTKRFIQTILEQFKAHEGFQCGIWYGGVFAGVVGFHRVDWMSERE